MSPKLAVETRRTHGGSETNLSRAKTHPLRTASTAPKGEKGGWNDRESKKKGFSKLGVFECWTGI